MGVKRGLDPHGRAGRPAACAVVTVSDTRGPRDDRSGDAVARALTRAGHRVVSRAWVRDDVAGIRRAVRAALARRAVDVVVLTGGTGIAPRDRTPEAVRPLLERELPGFGERFRALSVRDVGSAAWLSRAGAGVARGRLIVWLPGATRAVALAISRVAGPELAHAIRLLERPETGA
ncbi:MAG: MogA/MoaB family molybdenum cofactor biosynthesis protein [Candidatus Eisenbacteria bacterium]|uniref:Molybdenum cofactor biosynthesis protein B n=1 Tax=Eiseniibacteriota bacterium TaxID=2212470 RepID=A0A538TV90_UNCEI|nr:MAG: MogA/MoaB family molybdenum cofactor biosynthesis protein [Candidatus Eisenbacteria bacterium]